MLNLKWDSFSSQMTNSLDVCYEKQYFVDLSLVCKDGTILKCHKMVLANASSFFRRLLVINEHPHPMIILHDIEADDLKTIVNFMYCGEIQVVKSEVRRILKIAEILEVSGLKDIRTTILPPEFNNSCQECTKISDDSESSVKNRDLKTLKRTSPKSVDSSTSNFQRRIATSPKSFWNIGRRNNDPGKGIEAPSKFRHDSSRRNDNIEPECKKPPSTKWPTLENGSFDRETNSSRSSTNIITETTEKCMKKNVNQRSGEQISWVQVLGEISKDSEIPLKKLCIMDEVEITASSPTTESFPPDVRPREISESSGYSLNTESLFNCGVLVKDEVDIPFDLDCDSDETTIEDMHREEHPQEETNGPAVEIFKAKPGNKRSVSTRRKPSTLLELFARKSSGD